MNCNLALAGFILTHMNTLLWWTDDVTTCLLLIQLGCSNYDMIALSWVCFVPGRMARWESLAAAAWNFSHHVVPSALTRDGGGYRSLQGPTARPASRGPTKTGRCHFWKQEKARSDFRAGTKTRSRCLVWQPVQEDPKPDLQCHQGVWQPVQQPG